MDDRGEQNRILTVWGISSNSRAGKQLDWRRGLDVDAETEQVDSKGPRRLSD